MPSAYPSKAAKTALDRVYTTQYGLCTWLIAILLFICSLFLGSPNAHHTNPAQSVAIPQARPMVLKRHNACHPHDVLDLPDGPDRLIGSTAWDPLVDCSYREV